jgi:transcription antitermination factor NusG
MPILSAEPSIFPAGLLRAEPSGDAAPFALGQAGWVPSESATVLDQSVDEQRCWQVLYTKARQEKAVARELLRAEVPFYLPLIPKTAVRRGRRSTSYLPLFTGYVFLWGNEQERIRALKTNRLSRILPVERPEELVNDLRQIEQLIAAEAPLTIEERLQPGDPVRVTDGPFAGLEGTVLVRRGRRRLLVAVNFLQQGASVEIDDFMLEPC